MEKKWLIRRGRNGIEWKWMCLINFVVVWIAKSRKEMNENNINTKLNTKRKRMWFNMLLTNKG